MGKKEDSRKIAAERAAANAARAAREAQVRRAKRVRTAVFATGVVLACAAIIAAGVLGSRSATSAQPANALANGGGVSIGKGPVIVDLWEDFQCPACKQFEDAVASTLNALVDAGKATLVYHPLTFLDQNLGNTASTRAANAALCASDQERYREYHDIVYRNQPKSEGVGYSDVQLVTFAKDAGVGDIDTFKKCANDLRYEGYLAKVTVQMQKKGITSTPTVFIDGKEVPREQLSADGVRALVESAAKR